MHEAWTESFKITNNLISIETEYEKLYDIHNCARVQHNKINKIKYIKYRKRANVMNKRDTKYIH